MTLPKNPALAFAELMRAEIKREFTEEEQDLIDSAAEYCSEYVMEDGEDNT